MPSRGKYQIANQKDRKIAQRDQSFRNCVATLFVFFILFLLVLIANLLWKKTNTSSSSPSSTNVDEKHLMGYQYNNGYKKSEETTTTTGNTIDKSIDIITGEYISSNEKTSHNFENNTTMQKFLEMSTSRSPSDIINTLSNDTIITTNLQNRISTTVRRMESTEEPKVHYSNITDTILFENEVSENEQENSSTMTLTIIAETTNESIDKTESDSQVSTKYSTISTDNEFVSNSSSFDQISSKDNTNTITEKLNNITTAPFFYLNTSDLSTITDITKKNNSSLINNSTNQFLSSTTYKPIEFISKSTDFMKILLPQVENTFTKETVIMNEFVTNTFMTSNTESIFTTDSYITDIENNICNSGQCKQIAAKILSYMNHSADPCEDFYEYACGGMIADPQIIDLNLANKAYHRIAEQMLKDANRDPPSPFTKYYNSCMKYENINIDERIVIGKYSILMQLILLNTKEYLLVNEAINKIQRFDHEEFKSNFTNLYAELLKSYSPLLFDVAVDLDENNPSSYTIRVGPVLDKNLFDSENTDDFCYASEAEIQKQFVDLEDIYEDYTTCKQNNTRFVSSITNALKALGVFNNSDNMEQNVSITVFNIDNEIVQKFFSLFPSENEIRKAYLMKNYTEVSIDELNKTTTFINWYNLTTSLISKNVNTKFQVYFYEELVKGLQNLEAFWKNEPMYFHNAILSLYAQKLYHELIITKNQDMKQHCLKVSTNLLRSEASNLYMSSLSNKEITFMNRTVRILFDELKETLKLEIKKRSWVTDEERQALLSKINDLKLSIPEVSYFQYEEEYKLNLSDNYLENSLNLMRRYRLSIYSVISSEINPDTPKQIWTHYATPFQSKGVAVYSLNLIIIPFGAIDYGDVFISNYESSFSYLTWATIGNLIARQISHHFDPNGMHYWNQTRNTIYSLVSKHTMFEDYISCHKDSIYKEKMNMTLPLTSQKISFKISELTLNEYFSEIMGLRLTHDTFERLRSFSKNYLPWLEPNINQLFYLTYAQMYCTKSLLTTSYISLHENEELPSRIRVFVSASNNNLLGETWNCSKGSQIVPSITCDVFPYLKESEDTVIFSN
ncbi:neprilysin-2-like isoform X3 [Vespa mandarinia]|uniref:neprilysin-2-like isoform X3 n=1 Tax=Vespa mandarinia TaxID=7446 RepID=UPI00161B1BC9|nr:neprilysin-2-like isoform X3 [Vespa mandarinia]